ncbi:MAG: helix-turn-helix domain-containing protein [Roseiarcus sp.]
MNVPVLSTPSPGARATARDRETRRVRILALVQAGWPYAEIGRQEGLSRERVRQIVAQALGEGEGDSKLEHALVQIARLEPALRLAARGVADGDLRAIDRLLKVLDRLDKYSAVEAAGAPYDENARERLLAKLNSMAERIRQERERKQALGEAAASAGSPSGEEALDAPQPLENARFGQGNP